MSEVFEGEIIEVEPPTGNEARIRPACGRIADNGRDHHHRISPSLLRVGHLYLVWHCRVSLEDAAYLEANPLTTSTQHDASGASGWRIAKFWRESSLWCSLVQIGRRDNFQLMRDLLLLAIHLLVTLAKFLGPGGVRRVAAQSLLLRHQLLSSNRSRQRAPNLTMLDRLVLGLTTLVVSPHRIPKLSASLKSATLFKFHKALVHRKYRLLFSSSCRRRKPGPKGPCAQLIAAIVEMKHRNPKFGCVRIAQQIAHAFGIEIDRSRAAPACQNIFDPSRVPMVRPG